MPFRRPSNAHVLYAHRNIGVIIIKKKESTDRENNLTSRFTLGTGRGRYTADRPPSKLPSSRRIGPTAVHERARVRTVDGNKRVLNSKSPLQRCDGGHRATWRTITRRAITNERYPPGRVEYLIRVLSLAMSVVELMRRRTVSHPFRADGRLVFERPVERRVNGGQVEAAHGRAGYAVAVAATMKQRKTKSRTI